MLSRIQNLPKWAKITGIAVGGTLILIIMTTIIVMSINKNPFVGRWETDYVHYKGLADENVLHITFNSDGTFTFMKSNGVYSVKNGILTLDYDEIGEESTIEEYEITKDQLVLGGEAFFKRVDKFEKPLK